MMTTVLIGGMTRVARRFIDGGMRRGTPKALHENVITVQGGAGEWKLRLGFREEVHALLAAEARRPLTP
jgi:hypothetical protein